MGDYVWVAWKKKDLYPQPSIGDYMPSQFSLLYDGDENQSEDSMMDSFSQMETHIYGDDVRDEELYVLDWVLERKEILDLAESLGDKRLDRQFRRLSKVGLSTVFVVEGDNSAFDYLTDELYNKTILEGFLAEIEKRQGGAPYNGSDKDLPNYSQGTNKALFFHQTWKKEETVEFLLEFTNQLRESCRTEGFVSMLTLKEFTSFKPPETVKKVFERQLKEVKGCTKRKAQAITRLYPLPVKLVAAFDAADVDEKEVLLANITVELPDDSDEEEADKAEGGEGETQSNITAENAGGEGNQDQPPANKKKRTTKVGKTVSRNLYHLFAETEYDF